MLSSQDVWPVGGFRPVEEELSIKLVPLLHDHFR